MGKRGPAPAPTRLRLLRGDRVSTSEPIPSDAPVEPPDWLDADALAVWQRLSPDLVRHGVLTAWDVDTFATFCCAVVLHRRAVAAVNDSSVVLEARRGDGDVRKHPALQIVRDQAAIVRAFAGEFGLTPVARTRLTDFTFDGPKGPTSRLLTVPNTKETP